MNNTVILAEKPSQAGAYAEAFDTSERKNGYYIVSNNEFKNAIITYGFGHLVSLYSPEEYNENLKYWSLESLPITPSPFKFKVTKDKMKQYKIVKEHLDNADTIIIATDLDREGEAIARFIINHSGNSHKTIKRLWINSLEKNEIQKGFKNLKNGNDFYTMYKEAETRAFSDWLVGMNLSRLYTLYMQKNGMKGSFSIGRVQTPTLYLIYQRNKEIEEFVSKPFFELYSNFTHEKGKYKGKYAERFNSLEDLKAFEEENKLDNAKGIIKEVTTEEKRSYAPKLFSLSDLQSEMNKRFNYGASETLNIMQTLYEKKIVSYPRTDTNYIGTPEFEYLKNNLAEYLSLINKDIPDPQLNENKRYVNGKKVEEHYAIIPTKTIPKLDSLNEKERNVYEAILYRTLAIFETPYIYDETTILTEVNKVEFKTTGKIEKELGWKRIIKDEKENRKDEADLDTPLPNVLKDDEVVSDTEIKEGKTTPPKYYTEGTLITAMKNIGRNLDNEEDQDILKEIEGIGTEATRANVIDTLKYQKYITNKGKNILVTEKGKTLCSTLKDNEITNAELTAEWEKYLKKIREGQGTQERFLESITRFINHLIDTAPKTFKDSDIEDHVKKIEDENTVAPCPACDKNLVDKGKFYGCTGYPDCKFTLSKEFRNKKINKKEIKELLENKETIITNLKSKNGNKYNAKVKLNDKNYIEFVEFANK